MKKISHLTSVHPRFDTRIFLKECSSLANHGYSVSLVIADGKGNEKKTVLPSTMSARLKAVWIASGPHRAGCFKKHWNWMRTFTTCTILN